MLSKFNTKTHGKWILCGEHAVLRGHGAIVFPVIDKILNFEFIPNNSNELTIDSLYLGKNDPKIHQVITDIIFQAFELAQISAKSIIGNIKISSNIEAGIGMGASAALCVAISRWLHEENFIQNTYEFAKSLENFFHGQSSGLDIAAVNTENCIYFQGGDFKKIQLTWHPDLRISSCGEASTTSKCIGKTQNIWKHNQAYAKQLDERMQASTELAIHALQSNQPSRFAQLQQAIIQAHDCFQDWGLISKKMMEHIHDLQAQGAKAVKPTGSGGGGLVVSLWK